MSRESINWLNQNTLIGFTDKRGNGWHNRDDIMMLDGLNNHYAGAIPQEDILSRLFTFKAVERMLYVDSDFGPMPIEGKKAIVRSDNGHVMGIHSGNYRPHGYAEWLVDNLATLVGSGAYFANAGLLKGGAVAWVQIETPDNITTTGGVEFRPSILAGTSFDGSLATFYKPVITNVVCDNTMAGAMGEDGEVYRRKHTRYSKFVLSDAQSAIDMLNVTAETVATQIDAFTNIDVSDAYWSAFISAHVPIDDKSGKNSITLAENKRQALTQLYRTDVRVAPWAGTAWGVIQAVNTYNEHLAIVRNAERFERKMMNAVTGKTAEADKATIATLNTVMGRELISA